MPSMDIQPAQPILFQCRPSTKNGRLSPSDSVDVSDPQKKIKQYKLGSIEGSAATWIQFESSLSSLNWNFQPKWIVRVTKMPYAVGRLETLALSLSDDWIHWDQVSAMGPDGDPGDWSNHHHHLATCRPNRRPNALGRNQRPEFIPHSTSSWITFW